MGLVVVVTAVASLVAHNVYRQPVGAAGQPAAPTSTSAAAGTAQTSPTTVQMQLDAANSPSAQQVQAVLQKYFDAINHRDYDQWRTAVTSNLSQAQPEPLFAAGFATTKDDRITVYRVDTAPDDGLRVLVSFRSMQSLGTAPPDFQHDCIIWHMVWPLSWDSSRATLKVGAGMSGKTPERQAC
jgi:hypothetical protein